MDEMSKSPEEIKKGLSVYTPEEIKEILQQKWTIHMQEKLYRSALAYIQRLEEQNAKLVRKTEQLQRERDALLEDLADHCGSKTLCKKYEDGTCPYGYDCTLYLSTCEDYEWRGVPELSEECND